MGSHAARIEKSPRLQQLHEVMADGKWHGTRELSDATGSEAVHSDIHELRRNGYDILTRYAGKVNGRKRYEYQLQVEDQGRLF